jgi:hypothetical protein
MKRMLAVVGLALLCGCATFEKYGVTREVFLTGARLAAEKQGLGGAVTDEQLARFVDIVTSSPALLKLGSEVETNAVLQTRIEALWAKYVGSGLVTLPGVTVPVTPWTPPQGALYAGFLMDDAKVRVMNKLSINAAAKDFTALLKTQRAAGFNQMLFFLANEGDGGPVPTTFYRDKWFGDIDPDRVAMMRSRIQEAKAAGFAIELWGIADDSSSLSRASNEQLQAFYTACVEHFGDLADSWCVGLELDEWGRTWFNRAWHKPDMTTIQGCVAILKATGKPVAVHFTSYKEIALAHQSGADVLNAQFGWLSKPSEMTEAMNWINARKGNLKIVACEFNRDSTTPLASALAKAAMDAGAAGTQTGTPVPGAAPVADEWGKIKWTSENYAGAAQEFTLAARCDGDKVFFTFPAYSWPVKDGDLDAIACFFTWNGTAFEGGKFEWIRKGGQTVNELKNIREGYGGLKAPAKGTRVAFAWVSVDGKRRTNLAETVWP